LSGSGRPRDGRAGIDLYDDVLTETDGELLGEGVRPLELGVAGNGQVAVVVVDQIREGTGCSRSHWHGSVLWHVDGHTDDVLAVMPQTEAIVVKCQARGRRENRF
jgi:hypothetical protein